MTTARIALFLCAALSVGHACGAGLRVEDGEPARARCASAFAQPEPPPISMHRLPGSAAVQGTRDIAWLWFGSATDRYAHAALGNRVHGGSLHAVLRAEQRELALTLPADTVIEDRLPRLADLDGDGRDEAVVVESDLERGAALVVYGVEGAGNDTRWVERARSEHMGGMRWLNPVGVADFDGDGRLEIAAVATPHIGGVLTLYRYAPPRLVAIGRMQGVSNHRMGSPEQRLSAVVRGAAGPVVVVPDQRFTRLLLVRWTAARGWHHAAPAVNLATAVERVVASDEAACVQLRDGAWLRMH